MQKDYGQSDSAQNPKSKQTTTAAATTTTTTTTKWKVHLKTKQNGCTFLVVDTQDLARMSCRIVYDRHGPFVEVATGLFVERVQRMVLIEVPQGPEGVTCGHSEGGRMRGERIEP